MAKPPPRPSIPRSADHGLARSRALVPKPGNPRQPDLFAVPFLEPCKPKLASKVPVGPNWQYEVKHDGYRAQGHVLGGMVRIYTKRGFEMGAKVPAVTAELAMLPARSAVIDGEVVIANEDGTSDFFALHAAMAKGRAPSAVLVAFDLLSLDGEDWRPYPLSDRQSMLAELVSRAGPALSLSEAWVDDGPLLYRAACSHGLEGIVAKRRDAPYRAGYVDTWMKVKCTVIGSFAVVGFDPDGRTGVRSLRIARLVDDALVPCGAVGSGLTGESSRAIRSAIGAGRHVVLDVEYRGLTPAGELRHAVLKGWHGEI